MTTTENGQRDELAQVIAHEADKHHGFADGNLPPAQQDRELADAILAAGYRRPRTITTVEELDALPHFALVRGMDGSRHERRRDAWLRVVQYETEPHETKYIALPAVVQYDPRAERGS